MVDFGFFDDWHPAPGRIIAWTPAQQSRAAMLAAPAHLSPPSLQQEEYLRATLRTVDAGVRGSRLCMIVFDMPGQADLPAMGRTVTRFLRRHDTFGSWFTHEPDGSVVRRVIDPDMVEVTQTDHGCFNGGADIRAHVQATVPNALHWECFGFGVIQREESFTVYAAIDHLHTDGVAQALTCTDLLMLYGSELSGHAAELPAAGSHLAYCVRERHFNDRLRARSPKVRLWLDLLRRNGGDMPALPVDLGADTGAAYRRGAQITLPLFDEAAAARFERVCTESGGRFLSGLFAALALAELEFEDRAMYFALTPVNTRNSVDESASIGWYTNLVPIAFDVAADDRFATLVAKADRAADAVKDLTHVSPHRVVQLAAGEPGIRIGPGWAATMVSYVDVRKIPGVEMFDAIHGGMFANSAAPGAVYAWVNRFPDVTTLSLLFPDTPEARTSIERYVKALLSTITAVTAETADSNGSAR
ncbi:acyltransferase [Nocardia yunnanensis]|uniref:Acyltransferase n=1 Tax=Nocardia yunnanensis TaxID=2382165 RepID=A0A386ZD73_9NOCA|nr:condensation domain-containing protein [Nocardia yunnanensis]AYF75466.1 acyltransferase [Nocardia yunnanensis]